MSDCTLDVVDTICETISAVLSSASSTENPRIELPENYGYVLLVASGNPLLNIWLARNVMKARRKWSIRLPALFSQKNSAFNCMQRAHAQLVEEQPMFMMSLLFGGLVNPKICAATGLVYYIGKVMCSKGYYTKDPNSKMYIRISGVTLLVLLVNAIKFAYIQLKWIPDSAPWHTPFSSLVPNLGSCSGS